MLRGPDRWRSWSISSPCILFGICFLQHDIRLAFLWTSCMFYFKVFYAKLCMGLQNGGKVDSVIRDCLIHCKFVQVAVLSCYTKNGKLIGAHVRNGKHDVSSLCFSWTGVAFATRMDTLLRGKFPSENRLHISVGFSGWRERPGNSTASQVGCVSELPGDRHQCRAGPDLRRQNPTLRSADYQHVHGPSVHHFEHRGELRALLVGPLREPQGVPAAGCERRHMPRQRWALHRGRSKLHVHLRRDLPPAHEPQIR